MLQENIRAMRKARGLSQEEVAQRLHITRQTLSKWENGLSVPDAQLLIRLAEILEVSVSQLLEDNSESGPETGATVAEQLERLNLLLSERNRRSRRIWRVVAGILIGAAVLTILLILLSATAFLSFTTEPAVSGGGEVVAAENGSQFYGE